MKTFYLAHNFENRFDVRKWEHKIEDKYNIKLFNPFYDADRNDMVQLDKEGESRRESMKGLASFSIGECKKLVERDLRAIQQSDGIVTIIKSASFGTAMEIIMCAYIYRKPVIIISLSGVLTTHPWLRYMASLSKGRIFSTKKEFEQYVKKKFGLRHGL